MNSFDLIVLAFVGVAAIAGLLRGFVKEVLSLGAWVLAVLAIRYMHTPLSAMIIPQLQSETGGALLAFALLLLIPYAGMKLIASFASRAINVTALSPIDKLLGLGFGIVKGVIASVLAFSLLALGYDTVWGIAGRPTWITTARTYPFINAASDEMVRMISERRSTIDETARETRSADAP
ncbi:MAG: CvpA family protein [Caenibius sp.]